jgi:hypothetical protein
MHNSGAARREIDLAHAFGSLKIESEIDVTPKAARIRGATRGRHERGAAPPQNHLEGGFRIVKKRPDEQL